MKKLGGQMSGCPWSKLLPCSREVEVLSPSHQAQAAGPESSVECCQALSPGSLGSAVQHAAVVATGRVHIPAPTQGPLIILHAVSRLVPQID